MRIKYIYYNIKVSFALRLLKKFFESFKYESYIYNNKKIFTRNIPFIKNIIIIYNPLS